MKYLWQWDELVFFWNNNDFDLAHDWLNERWGRLVQTSPIGDRDPDARFLQGIAFAALALHFTQNSNQEGARLLLDDALMVLNQYQPSHLGVKVEPILETLQTLRPAIAVLAPDDDCPFQPFVYNKLILEPS